MVRRLGLNTQDRKQRPQRRVCLARLLNSWLSLDLGLSQDMRKAEMSDLMDTMD